MGEHPLATRVVAGETRALARVCRLVDDGVGEYRTILKQLFPHTGRAWTIGITGTPGAGKSTLTDKLIASFRRAGKRVAVIAIDPTSPFSGGAILGDRIRMQQHFEDRGVFIRSLATRGALGGLSRSAADIIRVADAWGADVVLVETVGVGQDELEVTRTVDTTLVVMAPGMGDDVQAIKAGILECADVFAVNKADREGADATVRDLELMIALGHTTRRSDSHGSAGHAGHAGHHGLLGMDHSGHHGSAREPAGEGPSGVDAGGHWDPPIVRCVALRGEGVDPLVDKLAAHKSWLERTEAGRTRKLARLREAMRHQLRQTLLEHAERSMGDAIEVAVQSVAQRAVDPYTAAETLVASFTALGRSTG
ncbi:MAG: methylmalonyl Co-A mutase-associated GTPase MeaB [Deltaproteobacteria bacterium]|nr:methylmalonyl Co-A mutase-associated GTPase MeaB [Deltaproteobacteria bacterium]